MTIREQIKKFILSNYLFTESDSALGDSESLVKSGIIDSTGVVELIMHIEETCDITVAQEEMIPDNFDSIDKVVAFVGRKQAKA